MSDILRDFDKKNEFPKVKIPKFVTGGICNDAIFFKLDAFSQIDEIVKDIKDRQDNAMAMEFTKCIGELLKKNGVTPKIKQYGCDFYGENSFSSKYGVIVDELDFSEHDKVFEDKIAELEKDYKTASELLGKYQQENESLKQRIDELEKELSSVVKEAERQEFIRDMSCLERQELIQRIAELESKKTEKPTKCTAVIVAKEINGQTYVTLDDFMSVVNDLQAKIGN